MQPNDNTLDQYINKFNLMFNIYLYVYITMHCGNRSAFMRRVRTTKRVEISIQIKFIKYSLHMHSSWCMRGFSI